MTERTVHSAEVNWFSDDDGDATKVVEASAAAEEIEPGDDPIATETPANDLPEKFKGKSLEDVVRSYTELEKEFGRRNNEIGELRKLTDQLVQAQTQALSQKEQAPQVEDNLSDDDFFSNPSDAVRKLIDKEVQKRLQPVEQTLQTEALTRRQAQTRSILDSEYTGWEKIVNSQEFVSWVQASPLRTQMVQQADQGDPAAAREVMEFYKAVKPSAFGTAEATPVVEAKKQAAKQEAIKAGAAETGNSMPRGKKPVFRRVDVIRMMQNDRERFESMHDEIMEAYREGRVR